MLSDRKFAKKHPTIQNKVDAEYSRREFEDAKTRLKLENQKKKSKRQLDLEKKYIDQGFSKDEAEIKAYNRAKTETILKVAGGITLASATAYVAYKHYDRVTDRVLKNGTDVMRFTSDRLEPNDRAFYAAVNNHDAKRYLGLYGHQLGNTGFVYAKAMKAAGNIKIASPETGRKILKNMFDNDKKMLETFRYVIDDPEIPMGVGILKQSRMFAKARKEIDSGKIGKNTYDAFNTMLVNHGSNQQPLTDEFYSALKKAGYGAIRDVNDKKNSGYFAKNPLIIFDTDKINVDKMRQLGESVIHKQFILETAKISAHMLANRYAKIGTAFATSLGTMKMVKKSNETKFVSEYRKQHPNTKLSNNEILKIKDQNRHA